MQYQQPPAPGAPPKEANALEQLIYDYQKQTDEHYRLIGTAPPKDETDLQKQARLKEWDKSHHLLQKQRMKATTLADLEAKLEKYRKEKFGKTRLELMAERHSPARKLAANLLANHEPKPSLIHQAHHIVPGTGSHKDMASVRLMLHSCKIGINDPFNGVWLPHLDQHRGHFLTPDSATHQDTLGWNYQQWISAKLSSASITPPDITALQTDSGNESNFVRELRMIKHRLKTGAYPPEIREPKDTSWPGAIL